MHGTWKVTGYGILPLAVVAVAACAALSSPRGCWRGCG